MKIPIIFCLIIINSFLVSGQENQKICADYQTNINNCIANDKYLEAQKITALVLKNCPSANENFYLNTEKIYLKNIEFASNTENKIILIKDLIKIFDLYDKKFPSNLNNNVVKKSLYLYDNKIGDKSSIFNFLDNYYKSKNASYNSPRALYIYFELFINESKKPNSTIKIEDLISKFIFLNSKIIASQNSLSVEIKKLQEKQSQNLLNNIEINELKTKTEDLQAFILVQEASKGLIEPYLSPENLNIYAAKNFEENKNNDFWLKFITNEMFNKNYYSNDIFKKIATTSDVLNSTSKSNFYLGYLEVLKNDKNQAEIYFNKSADLEKDNTDKANIYCNIATTVFGVNENLKAVEYLNKAINANPNFARPYLLLAQMYQTNTADCAKNDFEKKAINYLVITKLQKAIIAEPYLKNSLEKQIAESEKKLPTIAQIKESKMAGKIISIACFINESILIPNN